MRINGFLEQPLRLFNAHETIFACGDLGLRFSQHLSMPTRRFTLIMRNQH